MDVNAQNKVGLTALHFASIGGHFEVAEFLLSHRADLKLTRFVRFADA